MQTRVHRFKPVLCTLHKVTPQTTARTRELDTQVMKSTGVNSPDGQVGQTGPENGWNHAKNIYHEKQL